MRKRKREKEREKENSRVFCTASIKSEKHHDPLVTLERADPMDET